MTELGITWLGAGAILFIGISCLIGYYRGFVREVVSLMFMVLSVVIVWTINPYVSDFLKEKTPVYDTVRDQCGKTVSDQLSGEEGVGAQMEDSIISSLPLPDSMKENMSKNNNSQVYQYLAVDTFADYIADYLAVMITNGISFLLSYLLAIIGIRLIAHLLNLLVKLPVLSGVNRLAGVVMGCLRGILIVWIALLVMTICCNLDWGKQAMALVEKDRVLSFLYEKDLFVQIFLSIFYG